MDLGIKGRIALVSGADSGMGKEPRDCCWRRACASR